MVIENVAHAENFERQRRNPEDIHWIAGVDDTKAVAQENEPGEKCHRQNADGVFEQMAKKRDGFGFWVEINAEVFVLATIKGIIGVFRADDGYIPAVFHERAGFADYPVVEAERAILDEKQNSLLHLIEANTSK